MRLASQIGFIRSSSGWRMRQIREETNKNADMTTEAASAGFSFNSISSELLSDPRPGKIRNQAQDGDHKQ